MTGVFHCPLGWCKMPRWANLSNRHSDLPKHDCNHVQTMLCQGFSINACSDLPFRLARMRSNRIWLALLLLGAVILSLRELCAQAVTETNFKGTYNGLIYADGEPVPEQSGYFRMKVTPTGHFTGKVWIGRRHGSFHGNFDAQNAATVNVRLPHRKPENCLFCDPPVATMTNWVVTWTLTLQLINNREQITGQVLHRHGDRWTNALAGDRAGFDRTNSAPQAGRYTFALSGDADFASTN